jgi:hypothetical protein
MFSKVYINYAKFVIHSLLVILLIGAFTSELIYVIDPLKEIFQSLNFARLSYQKRQWLQEGPLVKTVNDMLEREYSQTKGSCFVELPYDELVSEGFGGRDPLLGQFGYLIYRTNYNLYPFHINWGYKKDNHFYRIIYNWEIIPEAKPFGTTAHYPCVLIISAQNNIVTITKTKGLDHAN